MQWHILTSVTNFQVHLIFPTSIDSIQLVAFQLRSVLSNLNRNLLTPDFSTSHFFQLPFPTMRIPYRGLTDANYDMLHVTCNFRHYKAIFNQYLSQRHKKWQKFLSKNDMERSCLPTFFDQWQSDSVGLIFSSMTVGFSRTYIFILGCAIAFLKKSRHNIIFQDEKKQFSVI